VPRDGEISARFRRCLRRATGAGTFLVTAPPVPVIEARPGFRLDQGEINARDGARLLATLLHTDDSDHGRHHVAYAVLGVGIPSLLH
jgi:hypothetical protein